MFWLFDIVRFLVSGCDFVSGFTCSSRVILEGWAAEIESAL